MSEGSYIKVDVLCPFYLSDDRRRILCEGAAPGAVTAQLFRRREDTELWLRQRCCRDYRHCPIHTGLMAKYGDET